MRYFVHGPECEKFGPADLDLLREWERQGRVLPDTMLEPEVGGSPTPARTLAGLFSQEPNLQAPPAQVLPWVLATAALGFCPIVLGTAAIVLACGARLRGYRFRTVLIAYAVCCTVCGVTISFLFARDYLVGVR